MTHTKTDEMKISDLEKVIDMQKAMIDGMRRVLAIARIVNNQREHILMTQALKDYDRCKLPEYDSNPIDQNPSPAVEGMRDALFFYGFNGCATPEEYRNKFKTDMGEKARRALEAYEKERAR